MTLNISGIDKLEWEGVYKSGPVKIIFFIRSKKLVGKGCLDFLAHLRDTSVEVSSIKSFLLVILFKEVYPTNLFGTPPDHDIDFCTDWSRPLALYLFLPMGWFWLS